MAQRKKPTVNQEDIDSAVEGLMTVLDIDSLSEVDRFFALDLLQEYGRMCGMSEAAWRSILGDGLTTRQSSGAKGNTHYRMVKSEAIDIHKMCVASKLALAAKISKFVNSSVVKEEEEVLDEFDSFNA